MGCIPGQNYDDPGQPSDLILELLCVAQGGTITEPHWQNKLDPDFNGWTSENIPVIAAAIALYEGPIVGGRDYRSWWNEFFFHQATPPSSSSTAKLDYFKGTELFSNIYDPATTNAVMGAFYWARENPSAPYAGSIELKARDYLRRTLYAWALTASPINTSTWSIEDVRGATSVTYTTDNRKCPIVAMASPRTKIKFDAEATNRWILAKALGGLSTDCYKSPQIKLLVDYLASEYWDIYGFTATERSQLRSLILYNSIPSSLGSVFGRIRTKTDVHFLIYSDGRRASYFLGSQLNNFISVGGNKGNALHVDLQPEQRPGPGTLHPGQEHLVVRGGVESPDLRRRPRHRRLWIEPVHHRTGEPVAPLRLGTERMEVVLDLVPVL